MFLDSSQDFILYRHFISEGKHEVKFAENEKKRGVNRAGNKSKGRLSRPFGKIRLTWWESDGGGNIVSRLKPLGLSGPTCLAFPRKRMCFLHVRETKQRMHRVRLVSETGGHRPCAAWIASKKKKWKHNQLLIWYQGLKSQSKQAADGLWRDWLKEALIIQNHACLTQQKTPPKIKILAQGEEGNGGCDAKEKRLLPS